MKRLALLLILGFLTAGQVRAAEAAKPASVPKPGASPAASPANAPAPALELKNKSTFKMDGASRNPFWPIGWKPSAKLADPGTEQVGGDISPNAFVVTSITVQQGAKFAIINGKIMQEGQQFGLQIGTQTYQITLKAIEDGKVILGRRDQEIIIPLRRK